MKWPEVKTRTYSGTSRYAVDLRKIGLKVKTFNFTNDGLGEAEEFADSIRARETELGKSAWNLSLEEVADATRALRTLKDSGSHLTLEHCVKQHLATIPKYAGININDAYDKYIIYKETNNIRTYKDTTIKEAKQKVKRLCNSLDKDTTTDAVTESCINHFLDENRYKENTRRSYWYAIRTFFQYCKKQQWCKTNPTDPMDKLEVTLRDIEFINPVEYVQEILDDTRKLAPQILPMVAIRLFAGVRTSEVSGLEPTDINLETGYIRVGAHLGKNGRRKGGRLVIIERNLSDILLKSPLQEHSKWSDYLWKKVKASIKQRLGYIITDNAPRKSYVTYHIAKTHDKKLTAKHCGNSVGTIEDFYQGLATKEDALKYFSYT